MFIPNPVKPGAPIKASEFNALLAFVKSLVPSGDGRTVFVKRNTGGVTISVIPGAPVSSSGGGGSVTLEHPFQVLDSSEVDEGDPGPEDDVVLPKVQVRFGQVNNVTPQIDSVDISATGPKLDLTSFGFDTTVNVYLHVTVDDPGVIIGATVVAVDTDIPEDDDNNAYLTVARITIDPEGAMLIEQSVTHSLQFQFCDRSVDEDDILVDAGDPQWWGI